MIPSKSTGTRFPKSAFWVLAAAFAVVAMGASAPQCARTSDTPLTPAVRSLDTQGVEECVDACNLAAKVQRSEEKLRHVAAVQACGEDEECLSDEEILHTMIMERIASENQECKSACHNQGGGFGGQ
jgi:hypothetical protein